MHATDVITDFIDFMDSEGVRPVEPIAQRLATGELIRFRCEGDSKGKQNGWAILYLDDRPAGAFGNYRLGTGTRKWKCGATNDLTPEERDALRKEWDEAKARRTAEIERSQHAAILDAADMWTRAQPGPHPYLTKKGIPGIGLRVLDGELLIPMYDDTGTLTNLQRVRADGQKRFLKGGRTEGLFHIIGTFTRRGETVCLGEGYATMHAVHRASKYPCIVAFSTGNLPRIGRLWADMRPDLDFIVCADDDAHLVAQGKENQGIIAAERTANLMGARVAYPPRAEAA